MPDAPHIAAEPHPDLHRALIARLAGDLTPVRRLPSPTRRWALWSTASVGFALGALALLGLGVPHSLAARADDPTTALAVALALAAALALGYAAARAAVPGRDAPWDIAVAAALVGATAVVVAAHQGDDATTGVLAFTRTGLPCVGVMLVVGAPPWLVLLAMVSRGLPTRPRIAGALAAGAAFLLATAVLEVLCPYGGRLHVLAWHVLPIVAVAPLSASLLATLHARHARAARRR